MITKGVISEVINEFRVKVRIPIYDKFENVANATPKEDLAEAIFCTMPGIKIIPAVGDVVIVGFEENTQGKPVILGFLYSQNGLKSISNYKLDSLNVSGSITVGDNASLQDTVNNLSNTVKELKEIVDWLVGQQQ